MTNNFEDLYNGEYTFRYLAQSSSRIIAIFENQERLGNPQSDWVSGSSWGSPIAPVAPPSVEGCNDITNC